VLPVRSIVRFEQELSVKSGLLAAIVGSTGTLGALTGTVCLLLMRSWGGNQSLREAAAEREIEVPRPS
jgi:hypothetical protein